MEAEKNHNQKLLQSLHNQLDDDIHGMKKLEMESSKEFSEIKNMKKEILDMNNNINKLRSDISASTKKMNSLKESLQWGEDALFAWEEELAKGEKEMEFLKNFKAQDDEKFQKLELERKQVEADLNEAKALEKREADRQLILETQLENISKLYKEAYNEKKRLTKVWFDSANVIHNREEDIQRNEEILCDVKNKARNKCIELYDQKAFYEEIKNMNDSIRKESNKDQIQYGKLKETVTELEKVTSFYKNEVDIRRKASGRIGTKLEGQRLKNAELTEKNKSRLQKYNKILEQNIHLQEQCDVLKVDSMSADQKYKNAQNMYEMSCKASAEDTRELERLNLLILQLKQEYGKLNEKYSLKKKELSYLVKTEEDLKSKLKGLETKYVDIENNVSNLLIEESVLSSQIIELQNKCNCRDEKEELEKEISQLEQKENDLIKEQNKIHLRIKNIQREYKDIINKLKNGEDEIKTLEENLRLMKRENEFVKKEIEKIKEEINKNRLQLNLLMMKESYSEQNIAHQDDTMNQLERQRIILEAAMKERKLEIDAQHELLVGKKRTFMEERSMFKRSIEYLHLRIKQIQSKYFLSMDLLGKDESGHSLSVAHFKIQLAQEKYELQIEGDNLEAKINKIELEIQAMENTLKLLTSANENYKISLESMDADDPEIVEKERLEKKYYEVRALIKEDSDFLISVKKEIEGLMCEISRIKELAKDLEEDWKQKEKEETFLEKELATKYAKLNRATQLLVKVMIEVRKSKEPVPYKKLAQKEIDIRIMEERTKSVLQQLSELTVNYMETKPIVNRYISENDLILPPSTSTTHKSFLSISSMQMESNRSKSSIKSDNSAASVINLDPNLIFKSIPSCLSLKRK
ncbi:coiled-coil domain-containing protein 39 isoform X2 [Halyomorpha halys]